MSSVAAVAPSGSTPPVSPFDMHNRSGRTSARSHANRGPVRPKPVSTSSAIRCTPAAAVRSRMSCSTCSSHTRMPLAPSTSGSTITAASSPPRSAISASSAAIVSPSVGSGSRATSNSSGSYICVKTPRPLAAIAPNVSPWYALSNAAIRRRGVPRLANDCSDSLMATSTAVEPSSEKKIFERPRGKRCTSSAASAAAGSCVKPAKITWSRRFACSVIASMMSS